MYKVPFMGSAPTPNPALIHLANRVHARVDAMLDNEMPSSVVSIRLDQDEQAMLCECAESNRLGETDSAVAKQLQKCVVDNRLSLNIDQVDLIFKTLH
tara:strand:+ start:1872 stop:2165 length:294 start_codon:yes stop_codon:yes gene_type:complete